MAGDQRIKTDRPGVYYRIRTRIGGKGEEKVYYVRYKKDGKTIEARAGRQYTDGMTPAKAALYRANLIEGREKPAPEQRAEEKRQGWTFDSLFEDYQAGKKPYRSLHTDELRYNRHLRQRIGKQKPKDLCPLDIERIKRVHCKDLSVQTTKHVLALIVRLARYGQKQGYCEGLNFIVSLPEVHNEKTEDLTNEQAERLLKVLNEWPDQNTAGIFKLAMVSGMRRGELFKLQWQDIDFERGYIRIIEPKGGQDATIPLSDAARQILAELPENDSPYVFPGKNGGPRKCVNRISREIRKKAGLPKDFRMLHGLRHYFASELASSGKVDMYVLQKLLTHKSPKMTQRYSHLRDEALREASSVANDILNRGGLRVVK